MVSIKLPSLISIALLSGLIILSVSSSVKAQEVENTAFISFGAGALTFFGDINDQNRDLHPSQGRFGYHLRLSNPVTEYLNVGLEAMFGKVGANERTLTRNLNFQSEIRSGGVFATYNFHHFLDEDRKVSPTVSFGVSGFEFLSKTDLYDREGRFYHYWDDGTIRDLNQNDPGAADAQFLVRDYDYESDLRELNLDGLGDYNERGVAFPLGIGAQLDMGSYLKMDIHTRMYLSTTDYVDNVSNEGVGNRLGDKQNDRFLYTGFAISYGLHKAVQVPKNDVLDKQLLANIKDRGDEDDDGVLDLIDYCPHTPEDVQVDERGCPLDGDGDGVPDYRDLELNTADSAFVDNEGVTLSDDYFSNRYQRFLSGNSENVITGTVESASIPKPVFTPRPGKRFLVQVGETKEGISEDLASLLLSIPDVQTLAKGDTVLYMIGDYDNLPDAVKRQLQLEEQGISGKVVSAEDDVVTAERSGARKARRELEEAGFDASENPFPADQVLWRVQVGAFKNKLSKNVFASLENMIIIYGEDGLTRYFSGVYEDRTDAETYRRILNNSGFNDAFLAAFRGGDKISISDAMGPLSNVSSDELWNRASPDGFDESMIRYMIRLAESDGAIETKKLEQFRELGKVKQTVVKGRTVYLTGDYSAFELAQEQLIDLHNAGLPEAEIVGNFNGEVVTLEEIELMRKN